MRSSVPDATVLAGLETPCYLLDPATVIEDLRDLRRELGTGVVVSVKASPVLDLLVRCSHELGDGIELASLGELNMTVGRLSVPRYVNTPAMDATLIAAAIACKATVIVENAHQLSLLHDLMDKPSLRSKTVSIALRLNAASLLGADGADRAPAADHFGMDLAALFGTLAQCGGDSRIQVTGLHAFAGSNSFASSSAALARRMAALVAQVHRDTDTRIGLVLLGAGLPADWRDGRVDFAAYREALAPLLTQVRVLHEAGRAVFARSGAFATRVVAVKHIDGRAVVVCDGGLAQCFLLAQTESFVKAPREPQLLRDGAVLSSADAPAGTYAVVGNSCNRADVIGRLRSDHPPLPGDLLMFERCGAYHSYSPTGFLNLRPARHYVAA